MTIAEMLARNARMFPHDTALVELKPGAKIRKEITWEVDFLLGFEQLEAARWASYLKPGGVAIVADVVVVPVSVIGGTVAYPGWDEVRGILAQYTDEAYLVPANGICLEVANPRALNMVMLGALSTFLGLGMAAWIENIRPRLPAKFVKSSLEAFSRGANEAKSMRLAKVARSR